MAAVKDALLAAQEAAAGALVSHVPNGVIVNDFGVGHLCTCGAVPVAAFGGSRDAAFAWHLSEVLGAEGLLAVSGA